MANNKKVLLIIGLATLLVCVGVILAFCSLFGSNGPLQQESLPNGEMTYTVLVKTGGGMPMEEVGVYIYEDATQAELVWFDKTNAEGKMSFTDKASDQYVAVLSDVPAGYRAEEYYPLTGELTEIVLAAGSMENADPETTKLGLGDLMMDFTVTTPDGTSYTLSELLETKKAVVLNFWYVECAPCRMEFPYMQEAYNIYKNELEILALNPVNTTDEEIAAFQEELGLTFPMAKVGPEWAQIMQLTAYPTTMVIDRYGNISLIHKGTIDNANTFEQMFAYFVSDDYVQGPIENLEDILTEQLEGTEDNPLEVAGQTSFEVTVQPETTFYINIYKVTTDKYLTIKGEDFYLTYKDKKYEPSNGSIGMMISSEGPSTPVQLQITNTGKKEQTYTITLGDPKGTYGNPYTLELGEFTVKVSAGNEQGVYYIYTATEDGALTVQCLESTSGVEYGYTLYNLSSYAFRTLEADGGKNEEGIPTLTVNVKKGQRIQLIVSTLPDETFSYPAGTFKMKAFMGEGLEEEEEVELEKTLYTVNVTDQDGNPMEGVTVDFKGDFVYEIPKEEDGETEGDSESGSSESTGDNTDTETGDGSDTETGDGSDTETGDGSDTETGDGSDTETGDGSDTETGDGSDAETGDGTDTETGDGTDTETGDGSDTEAGDGSDNESGDGTENEEDKDRFVEIKVDISLTTDEKGTVTTEQVSGPYTATVRLPSGYKADETKIELTKENPTANFQLKKIVQLNYTVQILDPAGNPVENVSVMLDTHFGATNAEGKFSVAMDEGEYTVFVVSGVPEEYVVPSTGFTFEPGTSELIIQLQTQPGTADNPIAVFGEFPIVTGKIPAGGEVYYDLYNVSEASLSIADEDAYIIYNGTTYPADNGIVFVQLPESSDSRAPESIVVGNSGTAEKSFTIGVAFPAGSMQNPVELNQVPGALFTVTDANDDAGYYYTWTATEPGTFFVKTVNTEGLVAGTDFDVMLTNTTTGSAPTMSESEDLSSVGVAVAAGHVVNVHVTALPDESWNYPALFLEFALDFVPGEGPGGEGDDDPGQEGLPAEMAYTVKVADYSGAVISNVAVQILKDGAPAAAGVTDANGVFTTTLATDTYQVKLAFPEAGYYYEDATAILTGRAPNLTVSVTTVLPGEGTVDHWALGNAGRVELGGTYVTTQPDVVNYFVFTPEQSGTYQFVISDPNAKISYWGTENWPTDLSETIDCEGNKFTLSIAQSRLGQTYVIGVTNTTDGILEVTRLGEAAFDPQELPYVAYEAKTPPKAFTLNLGGQKLNYVDMTAASNAYKLVLGADGYYHINNENGPLMYVNLGTGAPYISLYAMCGGVNSQTGTAFRYTDYSDYDNIVKEDYTNCILAYGACIDPETGVYPLTEDLMYMLKRGGGHMGWWDSENPNYLFAEMANMNPDHGWMFACCYVGDVTFEPMPEEPKPEDPKPEQPDDETPASLQYSVTVADFAGTGQSGVAVQILKDGVPKSAGVTDASGKFKVTLDAGTYQVKLAFSATGIYYEDATAILTKDAKDLTIRVTKTLPGEGVTDHWALGNAGSVTVGGTYVTMQADVVNYFIFTPEQSGTYRFTTSDPSAAISYWGTTSWPTDQTNTTDFANNAFTLSIGDSKLGQTYAIGVTNATDCILIITREGDAAFDPNEVPYTAYTVKTPPKKFTLSAPSGKKLTYVDLTGSTSEFNPVLGSDGYYHLGSASGPILYMNLGSSAPYVSLYYMCGGNGLTGTGFRYADYSDLNNIIKEDYTNCVLEYGGCMDASTGLYPLTEDLIYVVKQGGGYLGWWDSTNPNYLFTDVSGMNPELGWMFAVCYYA